MISVPIPEILPEDLDVNENCKYAIGPKTLSIMGKLNGRLVTVKKYQRTIPDCEISQLMSDEYETIRFALQTVLYLKQNSFYSIWTKMYNVVFKYYRCLCFIFIIS